MSRAIPEYKHHLKHQGCSIDIDMDRSRGEETDKILEWQGLTLDQCKNLTASTDRGKYWTYKRSERSCIVVKENAVKKELSAGSGVMSGVRECGTALNRMLLSSNIDFKPTSTSSRTPGRGSVNVSIMIIFV